MRAVKKNTTSTVCGLYKNTYGWLPSQNLFIPVSGPPQMFQFVDMRVKISTPEEKVNFYLRR